MIRTYAAGLPVEMARKDNMRQTSFAPLQKEVVPACDARRAPPNVKLTNSATNYISLVSAQSNISSAIT